MKILKQMKVMFLELIRIMVIHSQEKCMTEDEKLIIEDLSNFWKTIEYIFIPAEKVKEHLADAFEKMIM